MFIDWENGCWVYSSSFPQKSHDRRPAIQCQGGNSAFLVDCETFESNLCKINKCCAYMAVFIFLFLFLFHFPNSDFLFW
jgi:hypothetical protein